MQPLCATALAVFCEKGKIDVHVSARFAKCGGREGLLMAFGNRSRFS